MENKTFDSIKISLASPEKIREWSYGEVTKPETINYRTLKPEKEGLFCEKIFGPQKDLECSCGKYKKIRYLGKVCDRCGVEVTRKEVRRERMGHIELVTPVSHIWYFKGTPSRMGLLLDLSPRDLEKVLYFARYIVTDPGDTELEKKQILNIDEYTDMKEKYEDDFEAGMGAEAIKKLLEEINPAELCEQLREEIANSNGQRKSKLLKRLAVAEAFKLSGNRPEWMILDVVPVIPPDIRPMVQLDGGRFATSDLNDLYRRVINRNNRLKKLQEQNAPEIIVRNEKRMLQEAVDALIDNGRRGRPVTGPSSRALKSLSDMLKGKQGRFRQNLLGKRVDYSGRSVIVIGPELKMYQCGLPKEMAIELFKPFVMNRLVEKDSNLNIKRAKKMVENARQNEIVWDALEEVIKDHPVMLNRAPTLHRLGIQAFQPVLVEGHAIKLHPLVCTAFNADFDGDQMAVHVPLSAEAQAEARLLMLASNNLLKPSDGKPVCVPTQDMILGSYYLTLDKNDEPGEGKVFLSEDEAIMAYDEGDITLHSKIKIRMTKEVDGEMRTELVPTTLGKVIFNRPIPQDLGFVDRSDPDNAFKLEVDFLVNKKTLGQIIDKCIKIHGTAVSSRMLDDIKSQGYKYSTKSGITVAVSDATIPPQKSKYLEEAEGKVDAINEYYAHGLYSDEERSRAVIGVWEECTDKVAAGLKDNLGKYNPIYMMVDSGARGSEQQLRQLAGMRGLIANTSGKTIEVPIRSNYREGLNVLEYFISSRGARKGLADTALRTADSGYLTRRLVDVSQDVIISEEDCHAHDGIEVYDIKDGNEMIEPLSERLTGRYLFEDFVDKKGKVIVSKDELLTEERAQMVADIVNSNKDESKRRIKIRSLLTCECEHGVCVKCYGVNLATGRPVTIGEAVGIVAAQSIGEPGTQLTMRTFHTGGIASSQDITQGLPRVEELFEARKPKTYAILAEIDGQLSFREVKGNEHIVITDTETGNEKTYMIPYGFRKRFNDEFDDKGNPIMITKGTALTEGSPNPSDILAINGVEAVHDYLIREVQRTYRMQGVDINDKHIEIIVRQMIRKLKVTDSGSTDLLPNAIIDKNEVNKANRDAKEYAESKGEEFVPATCSPVLLGITKAALATNSFMSAASFQETTKSLTEAAISGKTDPLIGLKENVIIGKLLPSGTGMRRYGNVEIEKTFDDVIAEE